MKIENIDEALRLMKEFRQQQEVNRRLHDEGIITVHINGKEITVSNDLRKLIRKNLIEEVRAKREEIRKQLETL
mgnify:CR=1 FL=1